jgi:amidase
VAELEAYRTGLSGFADYWACLDQFRAEMFGFLRDYDAILSPACANPALPHGTSIEDHNFGGFSYTTTDNTSGWPATVVRCGESASGLPIDVQLAARPWREDVALAIARRLEQPITGTRTACSGWRQRDEG